MKEELTIILNLTRGENPKEKDLSADIFPLIILWEWDKNSFYEKKINDIQNSLDLSARIIIFRLICLTKSLNMLEIAKLTGYSYGLIRRYVSQLEKLQLIHVKKGKSSFGKNEVTVSKHENIKIIFLSELLKDKSKIIELVKGLQNDTLDMEEEFKKEFFKDLNKIRKNIK